MLVLPLLLPQPQARLASMQKLRGYRDRTHIDVATGWPPSKLNLGYNPAEVAATLPAPTRLGP